VTRHRPVKGDVVKTLGLFGLLSLLSIVACGRIEGAPGDAAQGPDRSVTLPAPAAMEGSGDVPARISEYVFLHQTRYENIPVLSVAGMTTCPE
jgi:hypothetical protein